MKKKTAARSSTTSNKSPFIFKEGTNVFSASMKDMAEAGYSPFAGGCLPGDVLLLAEDDGGCLFLELSAQGIRSSKLWDAGAVAVRVFRKR